MEAISNGAVTRNERVFLAEHVWRDEETKRNNLSIKIRMHERDREDEMLILQGATYLALRHF